MKTKFRWESQSQRLASDFGLPPNKQAGNTLSFPAKSLQGCHADQEQATNGQPPISLDGVIVTN